MLTNGIWKEKVLYSFCADANCQDGASPVGGLVLGSPGHLFGMTDEGGSNPSSGGVVFELIH